MHKDVHSLRYAVYCKEKGFLDPKNYPDGREYDTYDDYSVNFAAYSKSGDIVGTVRMVIPKPGQRFPYQDFCTPSSSVVLPPLGKAAEISRLIISPEFREKPDAVEFGFSSLLSLLARRSGAKQPNPEYTRVSPAIDQSTSPRLLLGLFRKMYRHSKEHEITHWYASMERTLARMLTRMHFSFHQISAPVDYYGPVSLYLASIEELEQTLEARNPTLLAWFRKSRGDNPPLPL
ncbi:MAG: PEP-CTERM/exosortase system-associated acyltransferase [Pseudomonadota bacterium]|nr:PEP-CTERM/exosortase system-associated acyltransferase [Pseudomonadota bacterium]